jgi:hypothetical protein
VTPFSDWPLLAGVLFIAMGLAFMHLSWQKLRNWPRVEGTVVALVRVAALRNPEIEYRDTTGTVRRCISRMPYHERLKVGDRVTVAVNPDNPEEAERVNFVTAILSPLLMLAFGVVVVLFRFGLTR